MAEQGRSIIFISHKLDEVKAFCDEATVLRGGKTVAASVPVDDLDARSMATLMVGEATEVSQRRVRTTEVGDTALAVENVSVVDVHGRSVVDDVSLTVKAGEIVGVAGVAGNGQRPLADALAGLRGLDAGSVSVSGEDISQKSPGQRNAAGLAYVPEDRLGVGLAPRMDAVENAMMRNYKSLGGGAFLDRKAATEQAESLIDRYQIKVGKIDAPLAGLSGGNLQRLLVGRELDAEPKVLIAAQPTRGLDVQGVAAIQKILVEQAANGVGILLISEDLEELFALSDSLLVMHEGAIADVFDPDTASRQAVGAAMTGA